MSKGLWFYIDVNLIDKFTHQVTDYVKSLGAGFKSFQTGNLQQYAMYMAVGVVVILSYVLMWGV